MGLELDLFQVSGGNQAVDQRDNFLLRQICQQPESAQSVQPQLAHSGGRGAAEHLGDENLATRYGYLAFRPGDAAEHYADHFPQLVVHRRGGVLSLISA